DPDPGALDRMLQRILAEEAARHTPEARIDRVLGYRAQQSRLAALEMRELAELWRQAQNELPPNATGTELDHAWRSLTAELAVAARVSDRTMQTRLSEASTLVERFPATLSALEQGAISLGHAHVI